MWEVWKEGVWGRLDAVEQGGKRVEGWEACKSCKIGRANQRLSDDGGQGKRS